MKSDRICWIDSRTIKRGCVLILDGSLVPFCSKCLVACMRSNGVLKSFEIRLSLRADWVTADSPHHRGGQSAPVPESLQWLWWAGGQSAPEGRTVRDRSRELAEALVGWRTVRPRWADGPPLYFNFVPERVSNWCGLQS